MDPWSHSPEIISKFIEICGTIISMIDEMIVRQLRALADPTRLRIVEFLAGCCCGHVALLEDGSVEGPTAGEVCCHVTGVDKVTSTISHHLQELEDAGLITKSRRGKAISCTLVPSAVLGVATSLRELAEVGTDCCSPGNEM